MAAIHQSSETDNTSTSRRIRMKEFLRAQTRLVLATATIFIFHILYVIIGPIIPIIADAQFYDLSALHLLDGTGFHATSGPDASMMPGYSIFLAALYALFGHRVWTIYFIQSLMFAVATAGVYLLVERQCGKKAAAFAFIALGLFPPWFIYTDILCAETLLLVAQVAFLAVTLRSTQRLRWAVGSGAACGLLTLIKPEFFVWLPLPAMLAGRMRAVRVLGASAIAFLVVLSPWIIRNAVTFNEFVPLTTRSGRALWLSAHRPELTEFTEPEFVAAEARCLVPNNPKASDACLSDEARGMIFEHPAYFLRTCAGRVFRTLVGSHTESLPTYSMAFGDAIRKRRIDILGVKGALLAFDVIFVAGGLIGLAFVCRDRRYWYLLYLVGSKLAVCAIFFGTARYGLHLSPLFAAGWGALGLKFTSRTTSPEPILDAASQ